VHKFSVTYAEGAVFQFLGVPEGNNLDPIEIKTQAPNVLSGDLF
jgi:hypothetical protein